MRYREVLNNMDKIIDVLLRRGFFIEFRDNQYYLSENSAKEDYDYLKKILSDYQVGQVSSSGRIEITTPYTQELENLFSPTESGTIGNESINIDQPWYKVITRDCAEKIPLAWLEPNIARYIKALSACGIYTGGCCDGNHPNCDTLYIEFDGPIYSEFHKLLWVYKLSELFSLNWNSEYNKIDLNGNRNYQYDELNRAAECIYSNRFLIRQIRKNAAKIITKKMIRSFSTSELKNIFLEEAKKEMKGAYQEWK